MPIVVIVAVKVRNVDIGDVLDQCVNDKKDLQEEVEFAKLPPFLHLLLSVFVALLVHCNTR